MKLIYNIGTLCTPTGLGHTDADFSEINDAVIAINGEIIEFAGKADDLPDEIRAACDEKINAHGALVTPGLVDAHTHLVFGGWRDFEVPLKLEGKGYMDILKSGGGILSTVRATRSATKEQLYEKSMMLLDEMLRLGVTTCEIKSGYGLNLDDEIKTLDVIKALDEGHAIDTVATFMGAHAVPEEFAGDEKAYADYICSAVLPQVAGMAEFCDVFCETGAFGVDSSRKILLAAKRHGLRPKIHADELEPIGASQLAGEVGAISAEHLIEVDGDGIKALANCGVIAVLLPATSFYLGKKYAPAKTLMEAGVPLALGSDFNPGSCPSPNLQLAMNMAYLKYGLSPRQVLTMATIGAARAVGREKAIGTIEKGKLADIVIWNADSLNMLCYRFGANQAHGVIKKGKVVV